MAYVQQANALQLFDAAERELRDLTKALAHLERAQTLRYDPEIDLRVRALKGEAGKCGFSRRPFWMGNMQ